MWEKDKQMLNLYRSCMQNLLSEVNAGEEIDWEDACAVESAKLQKYTFKQIDAYKARNFQNLSEKQTKYYTPRIPYHQDM